ncbi:Protein CBG11990 [Caenorhabditis briggsae]|uniref:Protein CBG11990 n=1 Tax=Caenorhabditis briggsae TaxID=6238 RepID=A8XEA4_CAEBR|nr:Protein CBG11990 [Caenorhabditis briggsae]CAP31039.2 Protein CBG11990 [Caenorhabditis briggsae]
MLRAVLPVSPLEEEEDSVAFNPRVIQSFVLSSAKPILSPPYCDGVTFEGITSTEFDDANCLLVSCNPTCQFNGPSTLNSSGVLSVLIHRIRNETTTIPTTTTKSSYIPEFRAVLSPFWFLAVAIGVAAICFGLNVTLCVVYCFYCRRKKRSQKAHISTVKGGPTLHAYNPQI